MVYPRLYGVLLQGRLQFFRRFVLLAFNTFLSLERKSTGETISTSRLITRVLFANIQLSNHCESRKSGALHIKNGCNFYKVQKSNKDGCEYMSNCPVTYKLPGIIINLFT